MASILEGHFLEQIHKMANISKHEGAMKKLAVILILLFPVSAFGASFDCGKAGTVVEKTICASPELGLLDEELADAYRSRLAATQQPAVLKSDQRRWISEVRNKCENNKQCLAETYKNCISTIKGREEISTEEQLAPAQMTVADISPHAVEVDKGMPELTSTLKSDQLATADIPSHTLEISKPVSESPPVSQLQEIPTVSVMPTPSSQNNLALSSQVSVPIERSQDKGETSSLLWKLFGAALFVNAITTIYLHRAGRLVIYKNYTDITFTGLAPLVGIIMFFILHFLEVPIEISRTVAFIVFACLVFLIAKSTYHNNRLSFFLMSLVTKLTIVIVYYTIKAFLIFGSGSARKKGERASTYEARKRREAKVNTAAMAAATAGFIGLSAWVCKDPEFVPLKEYLFQAKAA